MAEAIEEFNTPPLPSPASISINASYYSYGDRLIVSFEESPTPGMNVPVDDGSIELRVTLDERQLLGFEIPNFIHSFLLNHPEYLDFAETAGVPAETINELRSRITDNQLQESVVQGILRQFAGI